MVVLAAAHCEVRRAHACCVLVGVGGVGELVVHERKGELGYARVSRAQALSIALARPGCGKPRLHNSAAAQEQAGNSLR